MHSCSLDSIEPSAPTVRLFAHLHVPELNQVIPFKVDTGADVSIIPEHLIPSAVKRHPAQLSASVANGGSMNFTATITGTILADSLHIKHTFYVADKYSHRAILGSDFLNAHKLIIDYNLKLLIFPNQFTIPIHGHDKFHNLKVHSVETCTIPPKTSRVIRTKEIPAEFHILPAIVYIAKTKKLDTLNVEIDEDYSLVLKLYNNQDTPITIKDQSVLALLRPITAADSTITVDSLETDDALATPDLPKLLERLKLDLTQFTDSQQAEIRKVLTENYSAFSLNGEIGTANLDPIHIDFASTANPVRCLPYRQSAADSETMHSLITDMMQQKILEPASGQWSSPACLVYRNSKPRLVVDYRLVNRAITISNKAFLPTIQSLLKKIKPGSYLSCLDLSKAYWQFKIDDESSERLAIATDRGTFKPTRLPLGLVTSPSECCNAMQKVLQDLPVSNTLHYMDDVAVFHTSIDSLIDLTGLLLSKIKEFGLKINPDKTTLFTNKAKILGHIIDNNGVQLPPEYLEKIRNLPQPKSPKEVQVLLGLLNWCANFFPYMSTYVKPFTSLVKSSKADFQWTLEHEQAFQHLKHMMTSSPCLMHYDASLPLELYTDASDHAISAMLAHVIGDVHHPVAFWSRCLTKSEINYSIYYKEFLAVYASVKHFRPLLLGQNFTLYLDNTGVSFLRTLKISQSSPRIARFVTYLNQFRFTVKSIRSEFNPADTLSRQSCSDDSCEVCKLPKKFLPVPFRFGEENDVPVLPTEHKSTQTDRRRNSPPTEIHSLEISMMHDSSLAEEQNYDNELVLIKKAYLSNTLDSLFHNQLSPRMRKILIWIPNLVLHSDILMIRITDPTTQITSLKPILPSHLYESITETVHSSTLKHAGPMKTIQYIKSQCFAPGLDKVARHVISRCKKCASQKAYTRNQTAPMRSIPFSEPGAVIAVDHTGPYPSSQGYSYVLSITCVTSKHLVLIPQKAITAIATARALLTYFRYYGVPRSILSDNGTAFKNALMTELSKSLNVQQLFSTAGHPIGNAQAEKMNSFLKDLLTIATNYEGRSWPDHLMSIQLIYNATIHNGTGFTPNFLFFGRELRLPNSIFQDYEVPGHFSSLESHALDTVTRLREALQWAKQNNDSKLKIAKTYFDRNAGTINVYQPGQIVFLKTPGKKLELRYPLEFVVLRKLHDAVYEVQNCSNVRDIRKINVCRLKPYLAPLLPRNMDADTQTDLTGSLGLKSAAISANPGAPCTVPICERMLATSEQVDQTGSVSNSTVSRRTTDMEVRSSNPYVGSSVVAQDNRSLLPEEAGRVAQDADNAQTYKRLSVRSNTQNLIALVRTQNKRGPVSQPPAVDKVLLADSRNYPDSVDLDARHWTEGTPTAPFNCTQNETCTEKPQSQSQDKVSQDIDFLHNFSPTTEELKTNLTSTPITKPATQNDDNRVTYLNNAEETHVDLNPRTHSIENTQNKSSQKVTNSTARGESTPSCDTTKLSVDKADRLTQANEECTLPPNHSGVLQEASAVAPTQNTLVDNSVVMNLPHLANSSHTDSVQLLWDETPPSAMYNLCNTPEADPQFNTPRAKVASTSLATIHSAQKLAQPQTGDASHAKSTTFNRLRDKISRSAKESALTKLEIPGTNKPPAGKASDDTGPYAKTSQAKVPCAQAQSHYSKPPRLAKSAAAEKIKATSVSAPLESRKVLMVVRDFSKPNTKK